MLKYILLPDMINKCSSAETGKLASQYYSIIEVGGAHAHRFIAFMQFIDIPCLILTDIDSVKLTPGNKRPTKVYVSEGEKSSNSTINWWIRTQRNLESQTEVSLSDIRYMSAEEKTIAKIHLEFQTEEQGLCGRSLEEAIKNANRNICGLPNNASEEDIYFDNNDSKTEFALNLVLDHPDYQVPAYIRDGLRWLNDQSIIS